VGWRAIIGSAEDQSQVAVHSLRRKKKLVGKALHFSLLYAKLRWQQLHSASAALRPHLIRRGLRAIQIQHSFPTDPTARHQLANAQRSFDIKYRLWLLAIRHYTSHATDGGCGRMNRLARFCRSPLLDRDKRKSKLVSKPALAIWRACEEHGDSIAINRRPRTANRASPATDQLDSKPRLAAFSNNVASIFDTCPSTTSTPFSPPHLMAALLERKSQAETLGRVVSSLYRCLFATEYDYGMACDNSSVTDSKLWSVSFQLAEED
jgi:hypothetical protein